MGENFVNVTEGSGKKLHTFNKTIGANDVHDEYTLLGEHPLNSYLIGQDSSSTATANSHLLQIMAGATNKVRVRRIEMFQHTMATTVVLMETRLYRLTSAGTGGTVLTPAPLDPSDSASGATAMTLPTVKGAEGTFLAVAKPYMMQTLAVSEQLRQPILIWDFDRSRSKPLIINAGTTLGIAIKNVTAVAGGTVGFMVWIDESSF